MGGKQNGRESLFNRRPRARSLFGNDSQPVTIRRVLARDYTGRHMQDEIDSVEDKWKILVLDTLGSPFEIPTIDFCESYVRRKASSPGLNKRELSTLQGYRKSSANRSQSTIGQEDEGTAQEQKLEKQKIELEQRKLKKLHHSKVSMDLHK